MHIRSNSRLAGLIVRFAALPALLAALPLAAQRSLPLEISVDAGRTVRTMKGGIGASWHAMQGPYPERPGGGALAGSAWGGNPPASGEAAWRELYSHANWLGLDWCRVELEQKMYEPRRREFDWENPEMRALYRILDWAEKRNADVFLQQMWANVEWNAYPELRGSAWGRISSAPLSLDDFAYGFGEMVEHLTRVKGYRSIRWLAISNEPGHSWSWWQGPGGKPLPIAPGLAAVRKELDRRGIDIPLSGPDWTDLPVLEPEKIDFDPHIGAYDIHSYFAIFDGFRGGYPLSVAEERLARWAGWAHARNKPLFLSEIGTMAYGFGGNDPSPGIYESGLKDAALVVRGIRAGADAFNRWSLTNRGDLDGEWQMVNTWDQDERRFRRPFTPHPNTFYLYGLLSRLTAKHSAVLPVRLEPEPQKNARQVAAAALRSPAGELSLLVVNETYWDADATVRIDGLAPGRRLYRYAITPEHRDRAGFEVTPTPVAVDAGRFRDRISRLSVTVYSTYRLGPREPGI